MLNRKLKLVLLPLDERPCNRLFPQHLFRHNGIELVVPEALGKVKDRIAGFAEAEGLHAHARSVTIRYEEGGGTK